MLQNTKVTAFTVSALLRKHQQWSKTRLGLNEKIATLATKADLKAEQGKIKKLQAFDSSYFRDKSHFENNGTQSYLVFQPVLRLFQKKLLVAIICQRGNQKDCMMKALNLLRHLIIVLIQQ